MSFKFLFITYQHTTRTSPVRYPLEQSTVFRSEPICFICPLYHSVFHYLLSVLCLKIVCFALFFSLHLIYHFNLRSPM